MNASDPPYDHQRLVALEERLTHQQRLIEQLNDVVVAHERRLDQLGRDLARYASAVERLEASSGDDLPHEKPPHY